MEDLCISVIIVTKNRKDDLIRTLNNFTQQLYSNKEIIVVDNNSSNIDWKVIKEMFSDITFILLNKDYSLKAFDFGLEIAKGEIIWRTDDDSNPADINTFKKINNIFQNHSDIDIIATEIIEPDHNYLITNWYPIKINKNNVPENGFESNTFIGAGAAIRKKVFDKIGSFWGFGFEELDFSARAIIEGFNIRYYPNIITNHYCSHENRNRSQRLIIMAKQQIRYNSKYFGFLKSISRMLLIVISQNLEALTINTKPKDFFLLNKEMIKSFLNSRKNEKISVSKEIQKKITLNENMLFSLFRNFKQRFLRLKIRLK